MANGTNPEAHALLEEFATSPVVRDFLERLAATQRRSEDENWWRTDLGFAVEDVWGHLKIAVERAERR